MSASGDRPPRVMQAADSAAQNELDRGAPPGSLLIDTAVGGGLVLVLAIVFMLGRSPSGNGRREDNPPGGALEIISPRRERSDDRPGGALHLGVTPYEFDDVGKLLHSLGAGYRFRPVLFDELLDPDQLLQNDVLFLTCGGVPQRWLGMRLRDGQRGSGGIYRVKPEVARAVSRAFRRFAAEGGTIYASDLQFDLLTLAFPEFIDHDKTGRGIVQTVEARVIDPGLARRLGDSIALRFDRRAWRPAAFAGPEVTTYLQGTYETLEGSRTVGPLLVRFHFGEGTVIFTSFHNEVQNSQTELELLRYLVFTSVTAREESHVNRTMIRGGFSPAERNLLSASQGSRPVTETYQCTDRGPLQFVLGFEDRGARLRLTVIGPDGTRQEKSGRRTFTVGVSDAVVGRWQYTVTPIEVPYENFPFTLVVGEKR